eukprot:COSAG02_NODE_67352_length_253_cov_0.668831_1_plen_76_part_01
MASREHVDRSAVAVAAAATATASKINFRPAIVLSIAQLYLAIPSRYAFEYLTLKNSGWPSSIRRLPQAVSSVPKQS